MRALAARLHLTVLEVVRDPEFDANGLADRAAFLKRVPAPLATAMGKAAVGVANALRMQDTAAFFCRV